MNPYKTVVLNGGDFAPQETFWQRVTVATGPVL